MSTNSTPEQTLQQLRGAIKEAAAAAQASATQFRAEAFLGALAGKLDMMFGREEGDVLFNLVREQRA